MRYKLRKRGRKIKKNEARKRKRESEGKQGRK